MSVNNVKGNNYNYSSYLASKNKSSDDAKVENKTEKPAETTENKKNTSADGDTYVKGSYKQDTKKINMFQTELKNKTESFQRMISSMFQKQGVRYNKAAGIKDNLQNLIASGGVSEADKLQAQKDISEDGYWGVDATADRILDFAKALSGGDPSKAEELKNAVLKGFKEAEKAWGGELPEISQKTLDKVLKGFEEWTSSSSTEATAE